MKKDILIYLLLVILFSCTSETEPLNEDSARCYINSYMVKSLVELIDGKELEANKYAEKSKEVYIAFREYSKNKKERLGWGRSYKSIYFSILELVSKEQPKYKEKLTKFVEEQTKGKL